MENRKPSATGYLPPPSIQAAQAAGEGAAPPPSPPAGDSSGAPPSNTAPVNSLKGGSVKILRTGIDSLYLSYPGKVFAESTVTLEALKDLAQSTDPSRVLLAQYSAGNHHFEVRDRGSRLFAYVLVDNWFRINVASEKAKALPLAYAQIASELLTLQGPGEAERVLRGIVDTLGHRWSCASGQR
jgi:hypothetical protein